MSSVFIGGRSDDLTGWRIGKVLLLNTFIILICN